MRIIVYLLVSLTIFGAAAQERVSSLEDTRSTYCNTELGDYPIALTFPQIEKILGPYRQENREEKTGGAGELVRKAIQYLLTHPQLNVGSAAYNLKNFLRQIQSLAMPQVGYWKFEEFKGTDGSYGYRGLEGHSVVLRPVAGGVEVYTGKFMIDRSRYAPEFEWPRDHGYTALKKVGDIPIYKH